MQTIYVVMYNICIDGNKIFGLRSKKYSRQRRHSFEKSYPKPNLVVIVFPFYCTFGLISCHWKVQRLDRTRLRLGRTARVGKEAVLVFPGPEWECWALLTGWWQVCLAVNQPSP